MRSGVYLLLTIFLTVFSNASESHPEFPNYEIVSKTVNNDLKVGRTKMVFYLNDLGANEEPVRLVWSANKWIDTVFVTEPWWIEQVLKSGKYNFKFYVNSTYKEIIIPKMTIESGYTYTVNINFKPAKKENMNVRKPVIYLYPENSLQVNVKVFPKGRMIFTYPEYSAAGWNVLADPDGKLHLKDTELNYLFWESEQGMKTLTTSHGFMVEKDSTISFLERTLTQFGLNSREKADFITYWGPEMIRNERNFVQFVFNEDCEEFADLKISPEPDHVYRIYLLFISADTIILTQDGLPEQNIPTIDRSGFTVIEWGGSEVIYYEP